MVIVFSALFLIRILIGGGRREERMEDYYRN